MGHVLSRDWKKYWESSLKKWAVDIAFRVEHKIPFDYHRGWTGLSVLDPCGYCKEFNEHEKAGDCIECTLFEKEICANSYDKFHHFTLYRFTDEMKKKNPDWKKAEELRQQIVQAIEEDRPA